MYKLAPSILSADFSHLLDDVKKIEEGGADIIHIDVMDGHFVPNISFGAPVMKCLNGKTGLNYDVHLMITDPDKYIKDFVTDQTEYITIHSEIVKNIELIIYQIQAYGIKAGISVKPGTPLAYVDQFLDKVDMVLVMSVEPGFGGQKYMPEQLEKVKELKRLREERGLDFEIEIDGGVNLTNVKEIVDAGCDMVVAGSAVFGAEDIVERVKAFKAI